MHTSQLTAIPALLIATIAISIFCSSTIHAHQASTHRWRKRRRGGFFKPEAFDAFKATRGGSAHPHSIQLEGEHEHNHDQGNNSGQGHETRKADDGTKEGVSSLQQPSQIAAPPAQDFIPAQPSSQNTNTNRIYPLSICSIQGKRQYMEDEYFTNQNGSFCSVCDGHGGNAVSKYLRQNLYARYLQAKATTMVSSIMEENEYDSENQDNANGDETRHDIEDDSSDAEDAIRISNDPKQLLSDNLSKGDTALRKSPSSTIISKPLDGMKSRSLQTCMHALKSAFEKIDAEVQKISHWSFQGSTAVAVKLHKIASSEKTVLISANVGDSRAVLCRAGKAIDLTKDHKPNDPEERERIEGLGGRVDWFGPVDEKGRPVSGKRLAKNGSSHGFGGVYRINRNLALSRAIGDRSELPFVSSQVDIEQIELDEEKDEFVILASDGLWDVFHNSQEAIDLCQGILQRVGNPATNESNGAHFERVRRRMSKVLVREALKRGSMDNITVVIIWLSP
jgi:serine/threonine protein phosphatase PrpC